MPVTQPIQTYSDALLAAFTDLWSGVLGVIPNIIGAFIIFVVGWILALAFEQVVVQALKMLKVEKAFERLGWNTFFEKAEMKLDPSKSIGALVRWFIILAFLLAASDLLGLEAFTRFLQEVLTYIPNIFVASLILVVAVVVGDFADRVLAGAVKASGFGYGRFIGGVAKWSILVFAVLAALVQLRVAEQLVQTFFTGFIAMVAVGGGIAFGLGGKEFAADVLARIKGRMNEHM